MPRLSERQIAKREAEKAEREAIQKAESKAALRLNEKFSMFDSHGLIKLDEFLEAMFEATHGKGAYDDPKVSADDVRNELVLRLKHHGRAYSES